MQLPAFFGKKKAINLLPKDSFEASPLGMVMEWVLAAGKWAVIVTQLVVMAAFLWRFGLDRKLTNLRGEIEQQVAVITAYGEVEEDFLMAQRRVAAAKTTIAKEEETIQLVKLMQALTPRGVWYDRLSITPTNISLNAQASSLSGFSRFLTALQGEPKFRSVSVENIESGGEEGSQLSFTMTLGYKEEKRGK